MRYLLFPAEERQLVSLLHDELELKLLASKLAPDGVARVDPEPLGWVTDELPYSTVVERNSSASPPQELVFWCSDLGPIHTLGEAEPPTDMVEKVSLRLTQEATDHWRDVIDFRTTPVLTWSRPSWRRKDRSCVVAGRLRSMTIKVRDYPTEMWRLFNRVDRWLRKPAVKINPFRHCKDSPRPEPRNLNPFWISAWPEAKEWIDQGGETWPWDG